MINDIFRTFKYSFKKAVFISLFIILEAVLRPVWKTTDICLRPLMY